MNEETTYRINGKKFLANSPKYAAIRYLCWLEDLRNVSGSQTIIVGDRYSNFTTVELSYKQNLEINSKIL